jgi:hypothetical protein
MPKKPLNKCEFHLLNHLKPQKMKFELKMPEVKKILEMFREAFLNFKKYFA